MLLAVDVGNTNITFGLFSKRLKVFRLETRLAKSKGFSTALLKHLNAQGKGLRDVAVASVVPSMDRILKKFFLKHFRITPFFIDHRSKIQVRNLYHRPREVGADRIVNAAAAWQRFHRSVVVVDFGTATTFDCITARGEYAGGLIVPGPDLASESLRLKTAKLPFVRISKPKHLIGKTTRESIEAGLFYGYIALVDGLLDRLKKALGKGCKSIATGGLASLIAGSSRHLDKKSIYPNLTLEGISLIWNLTKNGQK